MVHTLYISRGPGGTGAKIYYCHLVVGTRIAIWSDFDRCKNLVTWNRRQRKIILSRFFITRDTRFSSSSICKVAFNLIICCYVITSFHLHENKHYIYKVLIAPLIISHITFYIWISKKIISPHFVKR